MVLLGIVAGLTFSVITAIGSAWRAHKARVGAFGNARAVFEIVANRLGQATLNTYWDYDDRGNPTRYLRKSELHLVVGKAAALLPDLEDTATDAVFFIAPLGIAETPADQPLVKLLSACGFYVRFGPQTGRPAFLDTLGGRVPPRYRYRLYQVMEPGQRLSVYENASGMGWLRAAAAGWSFPMADNVIGLLLRVRHPSPSGDVVAFGYDSRAFPGATPPPTLHQLPPVISVTVVMMDEESATRLAAQHGGEPPPVLPDPDWFDTEAEFEDDLGQWEEKLAGLKIRYQVLSADVPLRGAKWSSH